MAYKQYSVDEIDLSHVPEQFKEKKQQELKRWRAAQNQRPALIADRDTLQNRIRTSVLAKLRMSRDSDGDKMFYGDVSLHAE